MTIEYILLVFLFAFFVMGKLISGPSNAFKSSAPRLGARVEKQLITGEGFQIKVKGGGPLRWDQPKQ